MMPPSAFRLAPAAVSDTEAIASLQRALDTDHFTFSDPARIRKDIAAGCYTVARAGDEIVGAMSLCRKDGAYKIVTLISVRRGVGRALLEHAAAVCRREKVGKLYCWSLQQYDAAAFYRKCGFTEIYLLKNQWYGQNCYFCGMTIA